MFEVVFFVLIQKNYYGKYSWGVHALQVEETKISLDFTGTDRSLVYLWLRAQTVESDWLGLIPGSDT